MVYMTEQDPFCRGDGRAFHNRKRRGQKENKDITKKCQKPTSDYWWPDTGHVFETRDAPGSRLSLSDGAKVAAGRRTTGEGNAGGKEREGNDKNTKK
jgi:hypothetical protein